MKLHKLNYIQDRRCHYSSYTCPVCAGTGGTGNIFSTHCNISLNYLEMNLPKKKKANLFLVCTYKT